MIISSFWGIVFYVRNSILLGLTTKKDTTHLVAGPSAFYLSLYSGTGPSNAQVAMTAFSVVSMETGRLLVLVAVIMIVVAQIRTKG